jgi:hypothetical protein
MQLCSDMQLAGGDVTQLLDTALPDASVPAAPTSSERVRAWSLPSGLEIEAHNFCRRDSVLQLTISR